jgi:hypothetical protein
MTEPLYLMINERKRTRVLDRTINRAGDIRDFGAADGGDVTAAINAAKAVHREIVIPQNFHGYLSSGITFTEPGTRIVGYGHESILEATTDGFNLFTVQDNYCEFRDLSLYGAANDDATTQFGIFTAAANPAVGLKVFDVYFGGASASSRLNSGIKFDTDSHNGWVERCVFDEMQGDISGTGYGVLAGSVLTLHVSRSRFYAASGRGRHAVYLSAGASWCQVVHNYSLDMGEEHFTINANDTQPACEHNLIAFNDCRGGVPDASTGAISVWGNANRNAVRGNHINAPGEKGIVVQVRDGNSTDCDSLDNVVEDNQVIDADTIGIDIMGATRTKVQGNLVHGASTASSGTSAAIRIVSAAAAAAGQAATNTSVIANIVSGSTHHSALQLNTTTNIPTGTYARGNRFAAGGTATVSLGTAILDIDILGTFSDGTRPSAALLVAGSAIWNTTDNAPNYSDATDWRDAAGVVT